MSFLYHQSLLATLHFCITNPVVMQRRPFLLSGLMSAIHTLVKNRRLFLKPLSLVLPSAIVASLAAEGQPSPNTTFSHHVFFWLKNPANQAEYAQVLTGLKALSQIKEVRYLHVGTPTSNELERPFTDISYTFSVLLLFNNQAEQVAYLKGPVHRKFRTDNQGLVSKVIVYDSVMV